MNKSTDRKQVALAEGFVPDPRQDFHGKEFRLLDRYELQALLVETLAQTKNHRRKAAICADCHRVFRHWRCDQGDDWAEAENSCSVRVCPHCCCRRSKVLGERIDKFLVGREQSALRYVVLSERNSEDVAEGMRSLWAAWTKLRRSVCWKRKVRGCIAALEITYNREENTWHPHLNVLFEGDYFPHEELRLAWIEATALRGEIVWISRVDAGTMREMIKYVTKLSDLIGNVLALDRFLTAVHRKRFIRTYGTFYGLSVADEENPSRQKCCPDCGSTNIVALGRVRPQQVSIDFKGELRVRGQDPDVVRREEQEAESFRPGWFLRHKYAPRQGVRPDPETRERDAAKESLRKWYGELGARGKEVFRQLAG